MIISHKHKFIFIKTIRTAGTSIEVALSDICGSEDILTPFRKDNEHLRNGRGPQNYRLKHPNVPKRSIMKRLLGRPERHFHPSIGYYGHIPSYRVKNYIDDHIWQTYFKFAFERNPWDRQVSHYFYKHKNKLDIIPFEEFLKNKKKAWVDNFNLYTIDGNIALDFIGRFENLEADFQHVVDMIGLAPISLPFTNSTESRDRNYQIYYTNELREIVAKWYERELKCFDFSF